VDWIPWPTQDTTLAKRAGVSFDRTPAGPICGLAGGFRVCAYHIDFDERPTCFVDVATRALAEAICLDLQAHCGSWNVDYAIAWDEHGLVVGSGRPY